jgi:uncharacterized protein YbaR (Trm112 family)
MAVSPDLLEILRCPYCVSHQTRQPGEDPGRLTLYQDVWLVDETCGRKYPIRDDIPVMLVEEGEKWMGTAMDALPVPPPPE